MFDETMTLDSSDQMSIEYSTSPIADAINVSSVRISEITRSHITEYKPPVGIILTTTGNSGIASEFCGKGWRDDPCTTHQLHIAP